MLAICAALQWEVRPVLRALHQVRRVSKGSLRAWQGTSSSGLGNILVFRTGIGPHQARNSTRTALDRFPVTALINTGCAGALAPDLRRGDLVVASHLSRIGADNPDGVPTDPDWRNQLLHACRLTGLSVTEGPTVTSNEALLQAGQKQAAHGDLGAIAVDMEGAAVGSLAAERTLPFAYARAILDEAITNLPSLGDLADERGNVRPLRVVARVLAHPGELREFVTFGRAVRTVEESLQQVFRIMLKNGPDFRSLIDDSR